MALSFRIFFCLQKLCSLRRHSVFENNLKTISFGFWSDSSTKNIAVLRTGAWDDVPDPLSPLNHVAALSDVPASQGGCGGLPLQVSSTFIETPRAGAVTSHRGQACPPTNPPRPRCQGQACQQKKPIHQKLLES